MKTIRYKNNGRCWILPKVVSLHDGAKYKNGDVFYEVVDYRPVENGEWYLSGAIVSAYKYNGRNPTSSSYLIIKPTHIAKQTTCYERKGDKIV
jgi:hypothetical protein